MNSNSYAVSSTGQLWQWNCGWWCMQKRKGLLTPTSPRPLGHKEFRLSIQLLNLSTQREVLHDLDRPNRTWRRIIERAPFTYPSYTHLIYGTVKLKATDGQHAIIETRDNQLVKVCYANLTEIAFNPGPVKSVKGKSSNKPKAKAIKGKTTEDKLASLGIFI